jgi:hypothetical protein
MRLAECAIRVLAPSRGCAVRYVHPNILEASATPAVRSNGTGYGSPSPGTAVALIRALIAPPRVAGSMPWVLAV